MMAIRLSTGTRNFILDSGLNTLFDTDGAINIYTGTIPADADADVGAGTLLATLTFSSNWIGAASAGVMTLAAITSDTNVDASGTAAWFRMYDVSEGVTGSSSTKRRIDGTVGTSGADLNFDTVTFVAGGTAAISSFTITLPAS
jgi:hypothetical protein